MDFDDLLSGRPDDPLTLLTGQDLDPFSVDELDARIAVLEAEIARTAARRQFAVNHKASAASLFRT